MVRSRSGRSNLGCLVLLLIVTAVFYFAYPIGDAHWRAYRFKDRMAYEAEFATMRTDDDIRARLASYADSLGLPSPAGQVQVSRSDNRIRIRASYVHRFQLPFATRDVPFTPLVERRLRQ